jgi:hypothetical protein
LFGNTNQIIEEHLKEELPENIYASLRWRIHSLQNDKSRNFSKEQYVATINDITRWYTDALTRLIESRDK